MFKTTSLCLLLPSPLSVSPHCTLLNSSPQATFTSILLLSSSLFVLPFQCLHLITPLFSTAYIILSRTRFHRSCSIFLYPSLKETVKASFSQKTIMPKVSCDSLNAKMNFCRCEAVFRSSLSLTPRQLQPIPAPFASI